MNINESHMTILSQLAVLEERIGGNRRHAEAFWERTEARFDRLEDRVDQVLTHRPNNDSKRLWGIMQGLGWLIPLAVATGALVAVLLK